MPLLLDTQILIWWLLGDQRLRATTQELIATQPCHVSVACIWEVAIKASLGRGDFQVEPHALRMGLLREGFRELPIQTEHVLAVQHLPWIHRDPFDRLLVAQAQARSFTLLTCDRALTDYGAAVRWAGRPGP